jgi:metal-sulfur cluster biosynthetic enzyme
MTEETVNEIRWTIHETHPEKVKVAREKLSEVVDPEIGMNIIQMILRT